MQNPAAIAALPLPRPVVLNIARVLGRIVEKVEPNTARHLAATGHFAVRLARRLRFGGAAVRVIRLGAVLHDFGKIAVPQSLLLRQGSLSRREFALIQEHPGIGGEIIGEAGFDPAVATLVRQHHERLDGSGYPDGIEGGSIMEEALLVAVADEVDALVSHRTYRGGLTSRRIAEILEADAASRLPSAYVDAAIDLMNSRSEPA